MPCAEQTVILYMLHRIGCRSIMIYALSIVRSTPSEHVLPVQAAYCYYSTSPVRVAYCIDLVDR